MNLGCLVTLAANPADVYLLVLDNGLYEVTGGQPHAGAGTYRFRRRWPAARAFGGPTPSTPWTPGGAGRRRRCPGRGRWWCG